MTLPDAKSLSLEAELAQLRDKLQHTERFHARLLDAVQEAVIATDLEGRVLYWNQFAEKLYGWTAGEAVGRTVIDLTAMEGAQKDVEKILTVVQSGEAWSGETVLRRRDGTVFPAYVSDGPILDGNGNLIGIVGISYDVSPRKALEEQQALLIRELHHRVKNTLATVQAIMGATARSTISLQEFQETFTARIAALARTHSVLTEHQSQAVDFSTLLRSELEPFHDANRHRIVMNGPSVMLPSEIAVPLGMAIHELTTNAVKHGALGHEAGRVTVHWQELKDERKRTLSWVWNEHGGPPVQLPTREGFGSQLLRRVLTAQTGADVQIDYDPDGLRFSVVVPLPLSENLHNP